MARKFTDLTWRNETLVTSEICNIFYREVPFVIKTMEGYCGVVEDETLSKDDVSGLKHLKTR